MFGKKKKIPANITDFLKTKRDVSELKIALDVLKEFKGCESREEWLATSFDAWIKFEQLEEFLEHLVNGKPLEEDTQLYIECGCDREKMWKAVEAGLKYSKKHDGE